MDTVKERLIEFLKYKGISKSEFGRQIGVSSAFITSIRKSIQPDKIAAIKSNFPELSTAWLITGEGDMIKANTVHQDLSDTLISEEEISKNNRLIPFYDAETTGGFNGLVSSSTQEVALKGYINAGDWFEGRETAAIRHVGNSMTEYPDGCILAVKEVHEFRLLVPGRNYVIETEEYRITKRVQKSTTKNCIALYSSNQEKYDDGRLVYEPFEVMLSDVRRIFSVLGYIVNQSGEAKLIKP